MGSPKDITGSLTRWRSPQQPPMPTPTPEPEARAPAKQPSPALPALRRMRPDTTGVAIYVLLTGVLLSQFVFIMAFDLF